MRRRRINTVDIFEEEHKDIEDKNYREDTQYDP